MLSINLLNPSNLSHSAEQRHFQSNGPWRDRHPPSPEKGEMRVPERTAMFKASGGGGVDGSGEKCGRYISEGVDHESRVLPAFQ